MKPTTILLTGFIVFSFFYSNKIYSQTEVNGTISEAVTWTIAGSPYILTGNVTLSGGRLTIEPGCVVEMSIYYFNLIAGNNNGFYKSSSINAEGASFVASESTSQSFVYNGYCRLYNCGYGTGTLQNCDFENCKFIFHDLSTPVITGCRLVSGNLDNIAFNFVENSTATITNNIVSGYLYPVKISNVCAPSISENDFSGCTHEEIALSGEFRSDMTIGDYGYDYSLDAPWKIMGSVTTIEPGLVINMNGNFIGVSSSQGNNVKWDAKLKANNVSFIAGVDKVSDISFGGKDWATAGCSLDSCIFENIKFLVGSKSNCYIHASRIISDQFMEEAFLVYSTVRLRDNIIFGYNTGLSIQDYSGGSFVDSCLLFVQSSGINNSTDSVFLAINNYWAHPSGPYHSSLNPEGQGCHVSDQVDFIPWLDKPTERYENPFILDQPDDVSVNKGQNAVFGIKATGIGLNYRWRKDGMDLIDSERILGAHTDMVVIKDITDEDVGSYDCHVYNASEFVISSNARLMVRSNPGFLGGNFIDSRDEHEYDWVRIGNQIWMAENLAYLPSVSPPTLESYTEPFYYVYNYQGSNVDAAKSTQEYQTYGALYNWPAAMAGSITSSENPSEVQGVCPDEWHLPSIEEWEELADFISNDNGGYTKTDTEWLSVGDHLKSTSGWSSSGNGTDDYGFSGLAGGNREWNGMFVNQGIVGTWASTTEHETEIDWARGCFLNGQSSSFSRDYFYHKERGFSVRCVSDKKSFIEILSYKISDEHNALTDNKFSPGEEVKIKLEIKNNYEDLAIKVTSVKPIILDSDVIIEEDWLSTGETFINHGNSSFTTFGIPIRILNWTEDETFRMKFRIGYFSQTSGIYFEEDCPDILTFSTWKPQTDSYYTIPELVQIAKEDYSVFESEQIISTSYISFLKAQRCRSCDGLIGSTFLLNILSPITLAFNYGVLPQIGEFAVEHGAKHVARDFLEGTALSESFNYIYSVAGTGNNSAPENVYSNFFLTTSPKEVPEIGIPVKVIGKLMDGYKYTEGNLLSFDLKWPVIEPLAFVYDTFYTNEYKYYEYLKNQKKQVGSQLQYTGIVSEYAELDGDYYFTLFSAEEDPKEFLIRIFNLLYELQTRTVVCKANDISQLPELGSTVTVKGEYKVTKTILPFYGYRSLFDGYFYLDADEVLFESGSNTDLSNIGKTFFDVDPDIGPTMIKLEVESPSTLKSGSDPNYALHLFDEYGNHTGPIEGNGIIAEEYGIPGTYYSGADREDQFIYLAWPKTNLYFEVRADQPLKGNIVLEKFDPRDPNLLDTILISSLNFSSDSLISSMINFDTNTAGSFSRTNQTFESIPNNNIWYSDLIGQETLIEVSSHSFKNLIPDSLDLATLVINESVKPVQGSVQILESDDDVPRNIIKSSYNLKEILSTRAIYESSSLPVHISVNTRSGEPISSGFVIHLKEGGVKIIKDVLEKDLIKCYPNPFSHECIIEFPNPEARSYRLLITDLSGKVVRLIENVTSSTINLKQGDLKSGYYFVELVSVKDRFYGKVIIR